MTPKQQDPFSRCYPLKGKASAKVVCEHDNGTFVIGGEEEIDPEQKNRLRLHL
jgi:hypothetical protein